MKLLRSAVLSFVVFVLLMGMASAQTFCIYRGSGNDEQVALYEAWLGRSIPMVTDFVEYTTWEKMTNHALKWMLKSWESRSPADIVVSIGMLPNECKSDKAYHLQQGAAGAYNHYWQDVADTMISYGYQNSVIRLGWEMNGGWFAWSGAADIEAFRAYWRQIVTTMRSRAGANFTFCWNPNYGWGQLATTQYWPGGEYVDEIGVDVYDRCWTKGTYPIPEDATPQETLQRQKAAWDSIYNGSYGLKWYKEFAAQEGKPLSICEWGLWDRNDSPYAGGDNPYFIQKMYDYIFSGQVVRHCYFEFKGDCNHRLAIDDTLYPKSAALYLKLFGGANSSNADASAAKLTVVGVSAGEEQTGNDALRSIDDNVDTRWATNGNLGNAWIEYDLGSTESIDFVKLKLYKAGQRTYPLKIEIDGLEVYSGGTLLDEGLQTIDLPDTSGQYLKILMTDQNSDGLSWFSIYEAQIYKPFSPSEVEHAVKGVTAGAQQYGNAAENSYDESAVTRWANDGRLETAWIEYDLGSIQDLNTLKLKFYNGALRTYPLQIEIDGALVWSGITAKEGELQTIDIPDTSGRYVTILLTDKNSANSYWLSIHDIELWGTE